MLMAYTAQNLALALESQNSVLAAGHPSTQGICPQKPLGYKSGGEAGSHSTLEKKRLCPELEGHADIS